MTCEPKSPPILGRIRLNMKRYPMHPRRVVAFLDLRSETQPGLAALNAAIVSRKITSSKEESDGRTALMADPA